MSMETSSPKTRMTAMSSSSRIDPNQPRRASKPLDTTSRRVPVFLRAGISLGVPDLSLYEALIYSLTTPSCIDMNWPLTSTSSCTPAATIQMNDRKAGYDSRKPFLGATTQVCDMELRAKDRQRDQVRRDLHVMEGKHGLRPASIT